MRILLIDKDLNFLKHAAGLVERWASRATVVVAQSPSEAIASACIGDVDFVFIDAHMRDAAGVVRRLRESNGGRPLTAVALLPPRSGRRQRPIVVEADVALPKTDFGNELPRLLADAGKDE